MTVRVEPLGAAHLDGFRALFGAAGSGCFCRYWHFAGDKNAWLARSAHAPEENLRDQVDAVVGARDDGMGLVALEDDRVVGWMKLTPRRALGKLKALPVYRAAALGDDEGVFSVACFLVHPAHRGRGIARALLAAAPSFVRARGGRVLEAYPRAGADALGEHEVWQGPLPLFESEGFARHDAPHPPYPVLRRPA